MEDIKEVLIPEGYRLEHFMHYWLQYVALCFDKATGMNRKMAREEAERQRAKAKDVPTLVLDALRIDKKKRKTSGHRTLRYILDGIFRRRPETPGESFQDLMVEMGKRVWILDDNGKQMTTLTPLSQMTRIPSTQTPPRSNASSVSSSINISKSLPRRPKRCPLWPNQPRLAPFSPPPSWTVSTRRGRGSGE